MAMDAFIKFEGGKNPVKGESQDKTFVGTSGWSALESVSFTNKNTASIGTASAGATAGKVEFEDFTITRFVDNGSPQFFASLCAGETFDTVTIAIRKSTGGQAAATKPFLQYMFKMVFVTSIATDHSSGEEPPKETISFAHGAMQIQYTPQDQQGNLGTANPAQWSRVLNNNTLAVK